MICPKCGKEFKPQAFGQKFCSRACRKAVEKKPRKREATAPKKLIILKPELPSKARCYACGKIFKPAYEKEKFCSDECRFKFFRPALINAFGKVFSAKDFVEG